MKPRKVVIVIEAKSDSPIDILKSLYKMRREVENETETRRYFIEPHQVSVQVVKDAK